MRRNRFARRDPATNARAVEEYAVREDTNAAWLVAGDAWEEAGDQRRATLVRSLRPAALRAGHVRLDFLRGLEDGFWLSAWQTAMEELGESLPLQITRVSADPAPPAVAQFAKRYRSHLERLNRTTAARLYQRATLAQGDPISAELLGWYLAMQSQGHGVGWTDDHECFEVLLPEVSVSVEPGVRWHFAGEIDTRFARPIC